MNKKLIHLLNPLNKPLEQSLADEIGFRSVHSHGSLKQYFVDSLPYFYNSLTRGAMGFARGGGIGAVIGAGLAALTGNNILNYAEFGFEFGAIIDIVQLMIRGDFQIIDARYKAHFSSCSDLSCPYAFWNDKDDIAEHFKRELGLV